MNGKTKCNTLKTIRRDIAKANGIPLDIPECTHKGDCPGTCPRCESEVKYLERALAERRRKGLHVVIAGISAGLITGSITACAPTESAAPNDTENTVSEISADTAFKIPDLNDLERVTMGSIAYSPDTEPVSDTDTEASETEPTVAGFIQADPDSFDETIPEEEYMLEGDIVFPDDGAVMTEDAE